VFLLRSRIFKILFFFVANMSTIHLDYGVLVAQSLLGDRTWLMRYIEYSEKITHKSKNISLLPSDLFFNPKIPYKKKINSKIIGLSSELPLSKINEKIPTSQFKEKYEDRKLTESMLMRLFPWFSDQGLSKFSNENDSRLPNLEETELADIEFSGIFMWVSYIQKLLFSDPRKARLKFLEIEEKLNVEDRTLLKVQLFYFLNEWSKAENLAEAFLSEMPNSINTPLIFYYLNKSLLAQKKLLNKDPILSKLTIKYLEPKSRSEFLQILSDDSFLQGDILTALKFRIEELKNKETSKFSDKGILLRLLRDLNSLEELQELSENYPNLLWLQDQISLIKIEHFVKQKRYREALRVVENKLKYAKKIQDEEQIGYFEEIRKRVTTSVKINPKKIGVVLPLSSSNTKIARLAQETLNGLWIALHANEISLPKSNKGNWQKSQKNLISKSLKSSNIIKLKQKNKKSWELVVRDSHLSEEITKNVIQDLVEKEHVIAIIGPLARKTSEAAAEVAESLRVPLISLSLTDSISKIGEYIFRNNKNWKQEVSELLEYAVSELQACRFVILFTKTREGRQKMRHFWDEALKKGCEIVSVEGFKDEGQKSLVNEFDTFTGKNLYMSLEEKNILKNLKEKEDPIHNFDAIFIAVGSGGVKNLRLIFPYSSVYKMEKITFLGDSGWNDLAIQFAPGLRGIRAPVFVDSFFWGSKTFAMQMLQDLHERILYKHQNYFRPTSYTVYAYDTLMILFKLLKDKKIQSREELKEALMKMEPYQSVTGNLTFDRYGEIKRELQFLTLRSGKIRPLINKITD